MHDCAKEVKGNTAYLTAIELESGDVLFRSAPPTSNGYDLTFTGGAPVTGYGFSAEPALVYTLDAATGKTLQKILVPSSPENLAWSADERELHVRTYDHDLVFAAE